jgi:hypothetical protein
MSSLTDWLWTAVGVLWLGWVFYAWRRRHRRAKDIQIVDAFNAVVWRDSLGPRRVSAQFEAARRRLHSSGGWDLVVEPPFRRYSGMHIFDIKRLPFSRIEIGAALVRLMESEKDPKLRSNMATGFLALRNYQAGVGESPIAKIGAASEDSPRTREFKALFDRETDYQRNMFKRAETISLKAAWREMVVNLKG